jgi:outer membrane protein
MRYIKRLLFKRLCFISLLVAATCVGAQAEDSLSLAKAREAALANSKPLQAAGLGVDAALVAERQQAYTMLPSITASAGASTSYSSASQTTMGDSLAATAKLSVSQTVWDGSAVVLAAIDKIATKSAREAARAAYFDALTSVDSAYFSVLENAAIVAAAQSDLDSAKLSLSIAETKLATGTITKTDYLETESEAAAKETSLSQASRDLSIATRKLASLTGLKLPLSLEKVDFAQYGELIKKVSAYTEAQGDSFAASVRAAAYATNPTLSPSSLAVDSAKAKVTSAEVGYLPKVSASLSHSLSFAASSGLEPASGSISVTASIPLDVWATMASVDAAKIAVKKASLTDAETRRGFDLDVDTAVYDCIAQARSVISSEKAFEYASSHYADVLELYKLSSASASELSTAAALASSNQQSLISARYGFLTCISQIRSLGAFDSDEGAIKVFP